MKKSIFYLIIAASVTACVPMKKFQELEAGYNACKEENEKNKSRIGELETDLDKEKNKNKELTAQVSELEGEVDRLKKEYEALQQTYNKLSTSYDLMSENKNRMLQENAQETKKLLEELEVAQLNLQKREDSLKKLDLELKEREDKLKNLTNQLDERSQRVAELEAMLARKDSAVAAIRKKVQDALLGFENNGLTIEQRNGKVYVSLEESLLFALGKYEVDAKGQEVLKKLATVLEQNQDINITIEGHTDNVPLRGSGDIQDNWDLSVKRATSVLKIITENSKIDPTRLTASGRGEFIPIDPADTKEARQKNRRTEIILAPKLDELYEFLNEG